MRTLRVEHTGIIEVCAAHIIQDAVAQLRVFITENEQEQTPIRYRENGVLDAGELEKTADKGTRG